MLGGFVGTISLRTSWRALASGVRVELDRIYLVLGTKEVVENTEAQEQQASAAKQVSHRFDATRTNAEPVYTQHKTTATLTAAPWR
eukprot:3578454-Prymnesium_polylepis.1